MDFNLKQWRNQQQESENQESTTHPGKLPRLLLNFDSVSDSDSAASACALPLFVSEPTPTLTKLLSDSTATATKFPRMGSSYFSLAQWQELELQALIFRHIIAGAPVPLELLHLVKKSIISTSSPPSYYFSHPFQQYPHYQQALIQSGYWGRGAMDPEPGRCRRTDGKKWRCSRDVVAGQKYCERHVHRGRSRSRKPVEIPTPVINGAKNNTTVSNQAYAKMAAHAAAPRFSLSGHPPSIDDALHLNQRPSESKKGPPPEAQKDVSGNGKSSSGQILLHFFDDWPRQQQLQEGDNATSSVASSATSLSISMPSNPTSDFSLKLSTGNDYDFGPQVSNVERPTWGMSHQVSSMGGPLAEALRSSTTNSSPTSVLQQLARGSMSEASYIST